MSKIHAGIFAAILALSGPLGGGLAASAHGHGGGGGGVHFSGGGHMSSFHPSSFHSSSFHSSPSFHSSSFHSSFHSTPSFHSSSSFHSSPSFNSSSSGFGSFGFGSHHSRMSTPDANINSDSSMHSGSGSNSLFGHHHAHDMTSQPGINNDTGSSHHGGFLFWGHHNNNTPSFGDGSPTNVAYGHHHHHHQNFNNINMYPISTAPPPSTVIINMAPPPLTQAVPMHSLAITKYFYPQPQMSYNSGYFGGYGSTYGGYGYFPTRGIASMLFRLMSLIGFGARSNYGTRLSSNAYLGTWGPQSSLMTGAFDNANSTNFVDTYDNFNYTGGNVQPFANLLPDGTPYGDNNPQNLALQNRDAQNQSMQNPDANNLDATQNLLSMNTPNQYLPPSLSGQVTDNTIADPQNPVELKATAQPLQPDVAFGPPTYDYHHVGVLGSAFTHHAKLPAGAYRAPELLGIIFTHEFWDAQNQTQDEIQQTPIVTGQN